MNMYDCMCTCVVYSCMYEAFLGDWFRVFMNAYSIHLCFFSCGPTPERNASHATDPVLRRRFDNMDLWDTAGSADVPRFTIVILDSSARSASAADRRTCAVFFIPRGREFDYQFSSENGLRGIADEARCERLFAVRCNRPHVFGSNEELQDELSPLIFSMRPWVRRPLHAAQSISSDT